MELMHRFGSNLTEEYVDTYLDLISANPNACDNVWLATMYGFPKLETHRQYADKLKIIAQRLRDCGTGVSLQLSNSLGHGAYMSSRDCSGLVYEGSPVTKMVGHDGSVADYCFCWRDPYLREYLIKQLKYYSEILPECVWIDDDYRAMGHAPVEYGCFCENCMREFNSLHGSSFSREGLVHEILHGNVIWRRRYVAFLRQGLYDLLYDMCKAVHQVSDKSAMGLQHGFNGAYMGNGFGFLFDAMYDATGIPPKSRPGGGSYDDHNPNTFLKKNIWLNRQNSMLPGYVDCICPEIDNLPFTAFGKTPAGTAFEASFYFANGATDMSFSMMMHIKEKRDWYEKFFKAFSKHRRYWTMLSEYNKISHQSGLYYMISDHGWERSIGEQESFRELNWESFTELNLWLRDALPVAYDRDDTTITVLHPQTAKVVSADEVEWLMQNAVLTDGESIRILAERGFDIGVNAFRVPDHKRGKLGEKLSDHLVNPKDFTAWKTSFFTEGKTDCYYLMKSTAPLEIVGVYEPTIPLDALTDDADLPYGISAAVMTTRNGGKWGILGYAPWKGIINTNKRDQILNMADYISDGSLCARLKSSEQAVLLPRKNKCGKLVCVSVINCTIGRSGEQQLMMKNPESEKFLFVSQYEPKQYLSFEKRGDEYWLDLPELSPWSVGTVFCE